MEHKDCIKGQISIWDIIEEEPHQITIWEILEELEQNESEDTGEDYAA